MTFKEMLRSDVEKVFLDTGFFAETRTIKYDGETYTDVPVVLTGGNREKERVRRMADRSQGIFSLTDVLHCKPESIGGVQPETGTIMQISDAEDTTFFQRYYVGYSSLKEGMLKVELEAVIE